MAVDLNADEMLIWRDFAKLEQQECFDTLGSPIWREFEPSHYSDLKRQIGFSLFGVPEEEPCANSNDGTGYRDDKLKVINRIFDILKSCTINNPNPNNICVSFLFVSGKTKNGCIKVPFIRILHYDTNFRQNVNRFIDPCGRVYRNWQDYLDNNTIPECVLCYPSNGVYSAVNGAVEVEFGISPAGRTVAKVLDGLDFGGAVLGLGAAGVLFFGVLEPVPMSVYAVSILTGVYLAGRRIQSVMDRRQHQPSIGLDSDESRNCWVEIEDGWMNFDSGGNMAAAAKTAQTAATMPLAGQTVTKSCAVNGLAISNVLGNIIVKAINEKKVTALDVFQFTSAVLFFTHTVISTRQAKSVIKSMRKNTSGGSYVDINVLMNRIEKFVEQTKNCNNVPGVNVGCSPKVLSIAVETELSLMTVCSVVGRKLIEITISLLRSHISMCNYMLEVGELLGHLWESWNKEMTEVVDSICQAFGVKHWSELVIGGCGITEYGHITAIAKTLIVENNTLLVQCGCTTMPSHQRQGISDNSAVVGTDDGPNSVVDGETHNYYDEIANIFAKFVDRQMCRNPEDFCRYLRFVCEFVKVQFQKKKSPYEKSLEIAKRYNPDVNVENFKKEYGISGNPYDHFLQEVFNEFQSEEKDAFTLLHLAYEKENAGTSAQEDHNRQGCLDADGVRFYPFYSMCGVASNGMPSEQQYRELAGKLTGRHIDTDSIYMSAIGDTAVIQGNDGADVITVRCWEEDGKVSGIATVLRNSAE